MKNQAKRQCGKLVEVAEPIPAEDVLTEHGEIFSCGGVYLGLNRPAKPMGDRFEFLHLTNHHHETLVLNNQKVCRRFGPSFPGKEVSVQEIPSPEDALRRFFKESLN